ncbi:hypothetical protein BKA83DRAFT_269201 [Pisolithus microcarpus]|nr:hypothetical protein BKA83DRAFT_269201 [Pisolithus microcarpus]
MPRRRREIWLRSPRNLFCVVSSARVSAKLGETIPSKRAVYYRFFVWKGTVTQPLSCLLGDNNWNIVQRLSSRVHRSPSVSYCTVLSPFPASRKTQALFTPHLSSGTSVGKHRGHLHKVSPSFHGITLTCPPITTTLGHSMAISTLPHQYFSLPKRPLYIRMSSSTKFRMRWVSQYQAKSPIRVPGQYPNSVVWRKRRVLHDLLGMCRAVSPRRRNHNGAPWMYISSSSTWPAA